MVECAWPRTGAPAQGSYEALMYLLATNICVYVNRCRPESAYRRLFVAAALVVAALAGNPSPVAANPDVLNGLNAVRANGCSGRPGVTPALRENAQLVAAARREPADRDFQAALAATGYRATLSLMIHVSSDASAKSIAGFVAGKYCAYLIDSAYRDIGIHQRGRETWIVFAAPFSPPALEASHAVAERVLELVNRARSETRWCGKARFAAAGSLKLNATLNRASLAHAADMAQHSYLAHESRDGSTVAERVTRAGYRWRSVGENIASGQSTPEAVVDGWIRSSQHCANLMAPRFTEMGVAYSVNRASKAGIYWVQVFGASR